MFKKLDPSILERLRRIVGAADVLVDPERIEDYGHDEFSLSDIRRLPEAVVKPETREEVAAVLELADAERAPGDPPRRRDGSVRRLRARRSAGSSCRLKK